MLTSKEMLVYLSLITDGDVLKTLKLLYDRPEIDENLAKSMIAKVKSNIITVIDRDYPDYLKNIPYPPLVLYYYGDISLIYDVNQNISVVGSRENTPYGEKVTREIVKGMCKKYTIVSGLAKGIDSISHAEALKNNGKTIAVLGCGIDYCYPYENIEIYRKIKAKGLLISEYPNDLAPQPKWFVARNRLISALGSGLVVTEAKVQSGTASTVAHALQQNKDVFCVPYLAGEESGCNAMIRDGAFLVETSEDILSLLNHSK